MRRRVKTSYRKAGSSPSARQNRSQELSAGISEGSRLSPLARYIAENEDSGIPVQELVEQFRELDCEHRDTRVIAISHLRQVLVCDGCGKAMTVEL